MQNMHQLGTLIPNLDQRLQNGPLLPAAQPSLCTISTIAYRSDIPQPQGLFFCIPGTKVDGHNYAADAVANGAVALAVQHPLDPEVAAKLPADIPLIHFDDTRLALAQTASRFYGDPSASLAVCAVTGTNGKTTTTYLVDWICRYHLAMEAAGAAGAAGAAAQPEGPLWDTALWQAMGHTGLIGTVETRVGNERLASKYTTPESLDLQGLLARMRDARVTHVSMEASSHAIALHRVSGVHFAAAAFTNLTQDHLDFHGTMEAYFEAKAALFDSPLVARRVVDIDSDYGVRLAQRCRERGFDVLTCGCSEDAQVRASGLRFGPHATTVDLRLPGGAGGAGAPGGAAGAVGAGAHDGASAAGAADAGGNAAPSTTTLTYPLIGGFNVSNICLAAGVAWALGIPGPHITAALERCPQIPGRLERVHAQGLAPDDPAQPPLGVYVDYSHTPDSIAKALAALDKIKTARTIIVFGCGGDRDATKRPLMGAAALAADLAIVTSDNPRTEDPLRIIDDILPGMAAGAGRYEVEPDRRRAIALALRLAQPGDMVLIAGKGHEDYQLVGTQVLSFDDRVVAAEELAALAQTSHGAQALEEGRGAVAGVYRDKDDDKDGGPWS